MAFLSCEEMLAAARSQKITLAEAVLRSDLEESRLTEAHSRAAMRHLWQVMQATSQEYDPAQRSRSGLVLGHGHLFGAALQVEIARIAFFLQPFAQGVAQNLAALAKGHLHQLFQDCAVEHGRGAARQHAHHGAIDFGRGIETFRGHKQYVFHSVAPLQHHAKAAIVTGSWRSHHAVYYLFL